MNITDERGNSSFFNLESNTVKDQNSEEQERLKKCNQKFGLTQAKNKKIDTDILLRNMSEW